MLVIFTVSKIW